MSPYDVRQGNFSGGGINAITKSGTNSIRGEVLYVFRNQSWVGDGIDDRPIATFSDKQFGGSVGGPMARNRAFFFGNVEWQRRETPSGWSVDGSSGQAFGRKADIQRVLSIAQSRYGYNPGPITEFIRQNPNDKVFCASRLQPVGYPSTHRQAQLHRRGQRCRHHHEHALLLSRPVLRVHQQCELDGRAVEQRVRENGQRGTDHLPAHSRRAEQRNDPFPQINIRMGGGQDVRFGTEQFSARNELNQDIY